MSWRLLIGTALAATLLLPAEVASAVDPRIKCQADKNKVAGKYVSCRLKVVAEGLRTAEVPDFSNCDVRFIEAWRRAEAKAGAACPTRGDVDTLQRTLEKCTTEAETALETNPETPPPVCLKSGFLIGGHCWFVAVPSQGCTDLCASLALAYDGATESFAGSSGSLGNCQKLVNGYLAIVHPGLFAGAADVPCGDLGLGGLGCTWISIGYVSVPGRCVAPPTTPTAAHPQAARYCSCMTP